MRHRKSIYLIFLILFLIFISFIRYSSAELFIDSSEAKVIFFDVGQGDAALIQTPFNQDILIDSGPDGSIIEKLDKTMGLANRDIELAILSHNHDDHFGGFLEILKQENFKIEKIIFSNKNCENKICEIFFDELKNSEIQAVDLSQLNLGMNIELFCAENSECYGIDIIAPIAEFLDDKNLNNTSLILKARLPNGDFLFTGDAESEVWNYLNSRDVAMQRLYGLNADILKVPHHGSKNGLTLELLEAASPKEAIISCGKENSFGHPHPSVLNLLDSFDVEIRRTDVEGDIIY